MIVVAVGLFFSFTDPIYRGTDPQDPGIQVLQAEIAKYDEAITKSNELVKERDRLLAVKNNMDSGDRADLERVLPDSIDNIRLLIDIDNIALRYGMVLKNLRFTGDGGSKSSGGGQKTSDQTLNISGDDKVGSVTFGFAVSSKYDTFKQFLRDLEKSLRLIDVTSLTVKASQTQDYYDYDVTIKTYWLR